MSSQTLPCTLHTHLKCKIDLMSDFAPNPLSNTNIFAIPENNHAICNQCRPLLLASSTLLPQMSQIYCALQSTLTLMACTRNTTVNCPPIGS